MSTQQEIHQETTNPTARAAQVPQTSDVNVGVGGSSSSSSSSSASASNSSGSGSSISVDKASEALSRIVQLFSTSELHRTVATVYIHTAGKPCEGWSIGNLLLMYLASTADGRTYAAWHRAGRHVKKGSKAFYILEPRFVTRVKVDSAGEPVLSEGTPVTYQVLVGFRPSPRFRYEDTEGKPLEEYRPREMPPLSNVAEKWGVKVRYENTTRGEQGYFEPATNSIVLCVEDDPSTFFHELAHKAHSRIEELKPVQDAEQETIAELAACTLSEMYGYDVKGNSYEYIAHYAKSHSPEQVGRLCMRVLDKVKKVLDIILGAADAAAKENDSGRGEEIKSGQGLEGGQRGGQENKVQQREHAETVTETDIGMMGDVA